MRPGFIVIVDPAADPSPGPGAGLEGLEIDALVLERAPQPLDKDVVHPCQFPVGESQRLFDSSGAEVKLRQIGLQMSPFERYH